MMHSLPENDNLFNLENPPYPLTVAIGTRVKILAPVAERGISGVVCGFLPPYYKDTWVNVLLDTPAINTELETYFIPVEIQNLEIVE
jgi:hypothetical protein